MSIETRHLVVNSANTYFQRSSQKANLLDAKIVRTETIAMILELIQKGHIIEFTSIWSDHHNDSNLGRFSHFNGAAFDMWPLKSHHAGDYADVLGPQMGTLIRDIMASRWLAQCGFAGAADCDELKAIAGYVDYPENGRLFRDSGGDHIHVGCLFPKGAIL